MNKFVIASGVAAMVFGGYLIGHQSVNPTLDQRSASATLSAAAEPQAHIGNLFGQNRPINVLAAASPKSLAPHEQPVLEATNKNAAADMASDDETNAAMFSALRASGFPEEHVLEIEQLVKQQKEEAAQDKPPVSLEIRSANEVTDDLRESLTQSNVPPEIIEAMATPVEADPNEPAPPLPHKNAFPGS
jgi:hypothetical protein